MTNWGIINHIFLIELIRNKLKETEIIIKDRRTFKQTWRRTKNQHWNAKWKKTASKWRKKIKRNKWTSFLKQMKKYQNQKKSQIYSEWEVIWNHIHTQSWLVEVVTTIILVQNQTKIISVDLIKSCPSIHLHYHSQFIENTQSKRQEAANYCQLATIIIAKCVKLFRNEITGFTEFSIRDGSGRQLDPASAVWLRHLILCDIGINKWTTSVTFRWSSTFRSDQ